MNYLAIDLGGTNVRVAEIDKDGNILSISTRPSKAKESADIIINNILELINCFELDNIETIGICLPGPINDETRSMSQATNIPALKDYPIADVIEKHFNKKVYVGNDANCAGLGESYYGSGKGYEVVYYITHSTGIGGALIINNKIINGRNGYAGEIANVVVNTNANKINHLASGAVENEASGTAIGLLGKQLIGEEYDQAIKVFELARQNDERALKIVDDISRKFALMMSDISAIVSPDVFVIGGGVSNNSDVYFPLVEKYYKEYCHDLNNDTPIKKATLKEPGLLGAALLAHQ